MGVVYEAVQLSLGRRVALKVLPFAAALDRKQLQRFKNEAQAAAQLHHNNIVPVYAVGCERGVHFYAMQLIQGQPLSLLIRQMRSHGGARRRARTPSAAPPAGWPAIWLWVAWLPRATPTRRRGPPARLPMPTARPPPMPSASRRSLGQHDGHPYAGLELRSTLRPRPPRP